MELSNYSTLKRLLEKYNLWAKKRFGQHFLTDKKVLQTIIEQAQISPKDTIIEIGPGPGVLTRELCAHAKKVITIEKDREIIPLLQETTEEFQNLEIIEQDALEFIKKPRTKFPKTPYKLIANLPYNIATPLLRNFLQSENPPTHIVVLTQLEVAEKICSKHPDMNVLALTIQIYGKPKIIRRVSKHSFFPPPKVESAILEIQPYEKPIIPESDQKKYFELIHKAFSQKRKKLAKTLNIKKETLEKCRIDADARPQELTYQEWLKLLH